MSTKKALIDDAFKLRFSQFTAILRILGVKYDEIGDIIFPNNNRHQKMYRHCYQKMEQIPFVVINAVIKLVGERAYRIAYETIISKDRFRTMPKHLIVPEPVKPAETAKPKEETKPGEKKILIPKPIGKVESEKLPKLPDKEEKIEVKPKRKYKKRAKKSGNDESGVGLKEKKPIPEKKPEPVKLNDFVSSPDTVKKKSIFKEIGIPLSDLNIKK